MAEGLKVKGKRVLVVGLGKSGGAAALFLKERGAEVTVSDTKSEAELAQEIPKLLEHGIAVETGGHGACTFREKDLIVLSPGVPVDAPPLKQARELGIPVIGEIELAASFLKGKIVAITGSNGKTTTTALAGEVISWGGWEVQVGGNIGTPAISLAATSTDDTYNVLEISSFQLETIRKFAPFVAAVLNVTPDHLDRHGTLDAYVTAKSRIFENQTAADYAILNAEDPTCVSMAKKTKAQVRWFSRVREVNPGAFVRADKIYWQDSSGERAVMPLEVISLKGAHNVENVLAAVCVGVITDCEPGRIQRAVSEFKAVEHRLEYVATVNGVEYYNDSKATNVDATIKALEAFPGNIHIILGGKHKGSPYTVLNELLRQRVKRVYTIGAAAEIIENDIRGAAEVVRAGTLENAVRRAAESATAGDVVLLAPACASFDQFRSYEHRGAAFKEAVKTLRQSPAVGPRSSARMADDREPKTDGSG
jgi:UDP-N-acetylmuramoylalanine--D-glutamate ligase